MCGIAGMILKQTHFFDLKEKIVAMNKAIYHRGPDGEGYVFFDQKSVTPCYNDERQKYIRNDLNYIPKTNLKDSDSSAHIAFTHRRLSIIDLSETGHQPMCDANGKVWITFNGEIYNYIELRDELKKFGHFFVSESDTEVIINAYKQWGFDCVNKFNGMWAFCIYDSEKKLCFASRDRFGVKPFYYINNQGLFAFASEQKAFVKSQLIKPEINQKALHDYLINENLENQTQNFFEDVFELWPGTNLIYDVNKKSLDIKSYFHLSDVVNLSNDNLDETLLIQKINYALEASVKLRLRSDVEVGTCLSGGIDSSALALIISSITQKPLYCFTSVFKNQAINEEKYADIVTTKIVAKHKKVEPTLEGFLSEVDDLIYSQDVPIWSTSTYAQYKVMELAKKNNIKVVLDGQGADELFGGYHHHFIAQWKSLFLSGNHSDGLKSIAQSRKTIANPFLFYAKENLKQRYNFRQNQFSLFFNEAFIKQNAVRNRSQYFNDVNLQLMDDIYNTRLKSFLKCEDRCGMWHSVESRTPFSDDVNLIQLMFSFNGNKKIKNGVSKYLLREALKDKLPYEIYSRYDKKGFETPMQEWMQKIRPFVLSEIKKSEFSFVVYKTLERSNPNNVFHNQLLFKLFVLSKWKKLFI